jgi:hypothetical protein
LLNDVSSDMFLLLLLVKCLNVLLDMSSASVRVCVLMCDVFNYTHPTVHPDIYIEPTEKYISQKIQHTRRNIFIDLKLKPTL